MTLIANLHLTLAAPNALVLEAVRSYTRGFYRDLVTALPRIERGYAYPMAAPGLGAALQPELKRRSDVTMRRSALP